MKRILINATQREELRVAIVDGQRLIDLDIETAAREQKKSNVYKGRITRVEPSLEACFVDYGAERHGFLPLKEIHKSYFKPGAPNNSSNMKELVAEGTELIVQVEKEERGNKGAALTTFVSLAGRYLVLMPNNPRAGGISRRAEGEAREETKEALEALQLPSGMGVIVRSNGVGRSAEELQWDCNYLAEIWKAITEAVAKKPAPFLVYQENNIVLRALRDYLRPDIGEVWVDHHEVYTQAKEQMEATMPADLAKLKLYRDEVPLFSRYQVESQIEAAHESVLRLPSGGSIVIDHTEALTSIDINSAKSTGGGSIEETAFKTNCEAADEIARQLRLRDLGGLVVIDFIDMESNKNQREVEKRLERAVEMDRARIQLGKISKFGLLELSRQRLRPTLAEHMQITCPRCSGIGHIRSVESLALSILRLIEEEGMKDKTARVVAQIPVDVGTFLLNEKRANLQEIEKRCKVAVTLVPNETLDSPHFQINRIRGDHLDQDNNNAVSYKIPTDFKADERLSMPIVTVPAGKPVAEAAVQGIKPATPPPVVVAAAPAAPVAVAAAAPAMQAVTTTKDGFWARLAYVFGFGAKPVIEGKRREDKRDGKREERGARPDGRNDGRRDGNRNEQGRRDGQRQDQPRRDGRPGQPGGQPQQAQNNQQRRDGGRPQNGNEPRPQGERRDGRHAPQQAQPAAPAAAGQPQAQNPRPPQAERGPRPEGRPPREAGEQGGRPPRPQNNEGGRPPRDGAEAAGRPPRQDNAANPGRPPRDGGGRPPRPGSEAAAALSANPAAEAAPVATAPVELPPLPPETGFRPGLIGGTAPVASTAAASVVEAGVTAEAVATTGEEVDGEAGERDNTVPGGRSLRGRRNRRRGGRGRNGERTSTEGTANDAAESVEDAVEVGELSENPAAEPVALTEPLAAAAIPAVPAPVVAAEVSTETATPPPSPISAAPVQASLLESAEPAAAKPAAEAGAGGRPRRPESSELARPAAAAATPLAGAAVIARASEAGDYQPRLVVSGGDGRHSGPAVISASTPLPPRSASSDFMPRLLVSAGGNATVTRPVASGPLTSSSAASSDFLPRLLVTGENGPSARPPRPAPAPAEPAEAPVVEAAPPATLEASTEAADAAAPKTDPV
ncbi:Rne/Rng family ribonuclease [Stagnimonas aquatica]|uniref:Ribonuclease E n=1 Tax=Stagnimonas aquatica TaxID=2689987 RepID=A0A3N0V961_9GAMM|nr:Rne/Rng family ribonuclease [Stagnimonas aquatica]ROH89172.1 Rne/Rng family ribonuclease [Stagnimonas aquatica]